MIKKRAMVYKVPHPISSHNNSIDIESDVIDGETLILRGYILPTEARPFYNFSQIYTRGVEVTYTFRWNGKADCYFLDINESYDDPKIDDLFVSSIPVTEGINLIEQYEFTMTSLFCKRVNANPEIVTDRFKELGDTLQVYVITDYAEVA